MPSAFHELLVYLIRSMPGCAQALFRMADRPDGPSNWQDARLGDLTVVDSNLSVDSDRELRADLVLVESDDTMPDNRSQRGLVFEIQLDPPKEAKERAWLAYCAEFWLREHVEPALIVVTDDDTVAHRASQHLTPAGPALGVRPLVVHCRDVLAVFLRQDGSPNAELSLSRLREDASLRGLFLLALAHVVRKAPEAIRHFRPLFPEVLRCIDEQTAVRYTDAVSRLSTQAAHLVELIMRPYKEEPYEFKSEYFRPAYLKGRAEGKVEGKLEGKDEGRVEGKLEGILAGQRAALKRMLGRKQVLTAEVESQIDAAALGTLELWLDQVADGTIPTEFRKH